MAPVAVRSRDWRYLLPDGPAKRLVEYEARNLAGKGTVVDLSQSMGFGRLAGCVPTLRASHVKPLWLLVEKRWLLHSELAAMMGLPVVETWSHVSGVPLDTATNGAPPNSLGNAMHVACVGVAMVCASAFARRC